MIDGFDRAPGKEQQLVVDPRNHLFLSDHIDVFKGDKEEGEFPVIA
ncbi:MAG: hypothetical protein AAGA26_05520 [Pseudomonadota bacterium]